MRRRCLFRLHMAHLRLGLQVPLMPSLLRRRLGHNQPPGRMPPWDPCHGSSRPCRTLAVPHIRHQHGSRGSSNSHRCSSSSSHRYSSHPRMVTRLPCSLPLLHSPRACSPGSSPRERLLLMLSTASSAAMLAISNLRSRRAPSTFLQTVNTRTVVQCTDMGRSTASSRSLSLAAARAVRRSGGGGSSRRCRLHWLHRSRSRRRGRTRKSGCGERRTSARRPAFARRAALAAASSQVPARRPAEGEQVLQRHHRVGPPSTSTAGCRNPGTERMLRHRGTRLRHMLPPLHIPKRSSSFHPPQRQSQTAPIRRRPRKRDGDSSRMHSNVSLRSRWRTRSSGRSRRKLASQSKRHEKRHGFSARSRKKRRNSVESRRRLRAKRKPSRLRMLLPVISQTSTNSMPGKRGKK
mmetsp:Transcript_11065/g.39064  ORF Transcript_11065/g.39064 Transcript_11065/m.39064 type:complete len:406 (+) Transcript_11065:121-1338(+)